MINFLIPLGTSSQFFESAEYPYPKPLVEISGKPMIQHVWERAKEARLLDDLIIACDDARVADAAKEFGAACQ